MYHAAKMFLAFFAVYLTGVDGLLQAAIQAANYGTSGSSFPSVGPPYQSSWNQNTPQQWGTDSWSGNYPSSVIIPGGTYGSGLTGVPPIGIASSGSVSSNTLGNFPSLSYVGSSPSLGGWTNMNPSLYGSLLHGVPSMFGGWPQKKTPPKVGYPSFQHYPSYKPSYQQQIYQPQMPPASPFISTCVSYPSNGFGPSMNNLGSFGAPSYGAPSYGAPSYPSPSYPSPSYPSPSYGSPSYGSSSYSGSSYVAPSYATPTYSNRPFMGNSYGSSVYSTPPSVPSSYNSYGQQLYPASPTWYGPNSGATWVTADEILSRSLAESPQQNAEAGAAASSSADASAAESRSMSDMKEESKAAAKEAETEAKS